MNFDYLPQSVKNYLFYLLTIKGRSEETVNGYATDLKGFFKFMSYYKKNDSIPTKKQFNEYKYDLSKIEIDFIESITLLDIYEYLNFQMKELNNQDKARARKVSSIRGLYKYLTVNLRTLKNNPVENLEMPSLKKTLPKYLNINQSKKLLETSLSNNDKNKYRNYCILTLFLNCGMRLSELTNINMNDFNLSSGTLKLLGKGNKERVIFLNNISKKAIAEYLENYRNKIDLIKDKDALFVSRKTKKRLGKRQIENIVQLELRNAGLSNMGFSTHKLRHTAATLLYQHGSVDILVLKEILGHTNVGTTEIYTHVSNNFVKQEMEKNPLNEIDK